MSCFLLLAHCLGMVAWAAKLPVTTTLTVSTSSGPVTTVAAKTVVTLTAAVAGGGPGGQVTFCDASAPSCTEIHLLGTASVTSLGVATVKFVPGIGLHTYKAVYLGTTQNAGATSAVAKLTVTGSYRAATTLALSGSVGNYGLTATVVGNGPSAPSGAVSFLDASNSNAVLGTAMLGTASAGLSLANVASPAVGGSPYTIRSADLNGDGIPDLVTANSGAPGGTVLLGNGDGTFTQKTGSTFPLYTYYVVIADLNGDGIPDLVTSSPFQFTVNILLGNGDGTFRQGQAIPDNLYPFALATGDFNGDGVPDLVIGDANDHPMTIWMGNGDGTFGHPTSLGPSLTVWSIATGDFNGDGIVDVVATVGGNVLEFLGNGDGTFTTKPVPGFGAVGGNATIQVADFNRDGMLDLVLTNSFGGQVALGKGDGTFLPAASVYSGKSYFSEGAIGDFNGDGIADLVAADQANDLVVALGRGDGTFAVSYSTQKVNPNSVTSADFDGDGLSDVAESDGYTNTAAPLVAQRSATAMASLTAVSPLGTGAHVVKASYAGDATYGGSMSSTVSLNAAQAATTLTLSAAPPRGSSYGQQVALTAVLTPSTVQGNTTDGEAVTFLNGQAVIGMAPLANGAATLNVTTLPAGVDSLTATYAGDASFKASGGGAPLSYAVAGLTPRISFAVANQVYGVAPFAVNATSNSPGAITYSVVSGPATIAGNVVTLTGGGTAVLLASQAAAGNYAAATQTASFQVSAPLTSVTFRLFATKLVYARPTIFEVEIGLHGKNVPTGSVQVVDGSTVVGTYPVYPFLEGYVVGLTPRLTVGQHTLRARYLGDKNYAPGVSAPVTVMVSAGDRR